MELRAEIQSEQIPLDVSVCLYRVAIETLRNVSRHSGASSASVALADRTAESHKYETIEGLGVKTTAELIQYAVKLGLTST